MRKNVNLLVALVGIFAVSLSVSALPPIYMKYDGIKGDVQAAGHAGSIEIQSGSFGETSPTARQAKRGASSCATGPFKFSVAGTPSADLARLCQSRRSVGTVVVDIDGVKHSFENASFTSCQSGNGTVPTDQFSLNFSKCSFHGGVRVAAGDVNGDSTPNARLVGLSTGPVAVRLESLKLNAGGTGATLAFAKAGAGTLILPAGNSPLPELVLELTNGTKWTFLQVTMKGVLVSSYSPSGASAAEEFSLNFEKVVGPVAGYPMR